MATITSAGIGSGLDVETIVSKLMSIEQTPVTNIQKANTTLQTKISAYGKIQSALSTMQDAARKLTNATTWSAATATSSDSASVSVVASQASAGSYALQVNSLAASQSISSQVFTDATTAVGQGTLTIELGSWNSDQTEFTAKTGKTAINIDIVAGKDSLTSIRDQINAAGAGVVASLVTDTSGSRLVLRSESTGASNGFRISNADGGLSALTYDPSAGVTNMTASQQAANASFTLNGLSLSSETNTLNDTVEGLSINLLKTTSSAVTLNVSSDTTSIKKTITDFITAYNSVVTLVRDQTKYDESSKTAGTLQGDTRATGLLTQLRNLTGGSTTLSSSFKRLADIGIDTARDGTLSVTSSSKLDVALGKLSDLKTLFNGVDSSDSNNSGFAQKWSSFTTRVLGSDGTISNATQGLQKRVKDNNKSIDSLEDHLALVEKRLRAQYTSLDTRMSSLTALSDYVKKQFASSSSSS